MDLLEIDNVDPFKHWYYITKFKAVKFALSAFKLKEYRVLDVGAGSGYFTENLILNDSAISGTCIDVNYKNTHDHKQLPIKYSKNYQIEDVKNARVILLMDVLEHVENDSKLLSEYVSNSTPGTLVIITVPAFQQLWSGHDVFLGHFRRYKLNDVENLVIKSDLKIHSITYLFGSIFPLAWVVRKINRTKIKSDMKNNSFFINYLLTLLLNFEHKFLRNRFFGTSVLAVCEVQN
jgi:hypothetical protein